MANTGLKTSLNAIREISSEIYHKYIPEIDEDTDISRLATPIFEVPEVYNEFCNALVNRIVYTQFENKAFRNPFVVLDGDQIPLGYAGQEIYINPQKGRQFNVDDFAGLLVKYEADVKVQYQTINSDLQYPVTVSRHKLKQAFVSWDALDSFIGELSNSLYNGAYIDEYQKVKELVSGAYSMNIAQYTTVSAVSSADTGKAFVQKARELFLNMQLPSYLYLINESQENPTFTGIYYQRILFDYPTWNNKDLNKLYKDNTKLVGYSTDDIERLEVFDSTYEKSELIKSMTYKDDKFGAYSKVLGKSDVEELIKYTKDKINESIDKIIEGDFEINPKIYNGKNISCTYCPFADICYKKVSDQIYLDKVEDLSFLGGDNNALD